MQKDANAELRDLMKDCEGDKVRVERSKQIKSLGQVALSLSVIVVFFLKMLLHRNYNP